MSKIGPLLKTAEQAFGGTWLLGEFAIMLSRAHHLRPDPLRQAVIRDIAERGFYIPFDTHHVKLSFTPDGRVSGLNPYRKLGQSSVDSIVAKLVPAGKPGSSRHLVLVNHCYGLPFPRIMERLFGLKEAEHVDVAYSIMNHHYRGSYPVWPGTGFATPRLAQMLENLRSSITGVRALIAGLKAARHYETVTVIGYSMGGQLALHVANSMDVDNVVLYCPLVSIHAAAGELGLTKVLKRPGKHALRLMKSDFSLDDLKLGDPLAYPLRIPEDRLHVLVQRYDALAPTHQVEPLRKKYPGAHWYEFKGSHLVPRGQAEFRELIRKLLHEENIVASSEWRAPRN